MKLNFQIQEVHDVGNKVKQVENLLVHAEGSEASLKTALAQLLKVNQQIQHHQVVALQLRNNVKTLESEKEQQAASATAAQKVLIGRLEQKKIDSLRHSNTKCPKCTSMEALLALFIQLDWVICSSLG
eukprot:Filipodium_phascolosomae@DN6858_c0_g1_i1.p1